MSKPWTAVPNAALCDNTLSVNARFLYSVLRTYAWNRDGEMKVWPSCATLANTMASSISTVKRAIKELEDRKWVTRKERKGTSSLTYIHDPGEVTSDPTKTTGQVTHDEGGRSPMTHEVECIEEDKDPALENVREITRTEDEGDLPPQMLPPSSGLGARKKRKPKVNHSLTREVYVPLAGMWDGEAVALGYGARDPSEEVGILPLVVKARKATGGTQSPLNDPDAILAGLRKRASKGGFWQGAFNFRMLFLSKGGSWYCKQLAWEGKQEDAYEMPITRVTGEDKYEDG